MNNNLKFKNMRKIQIQLEKNQKDLWKKLEDEKPKVNKTFMYKKRKINKRKYRHKSHIRPIIPYRYLKKYRTTIDIDKGDKEFIMNIWKKIILCPYCLSTEINPSSFKGYHITIFCTKRCDICRFVYDDFRRFAYDQNRLYYARNILFQDKEIMRLKI